MKPPLARILEAGGVSAAQWAVSTVFQKVKDRLDVQKKLTERVEKIEHDITEMKEKAKK